MRTSVKIAIAVLGLLAAASIGVALYVAWPYIEGAPSAEMVQTMRYEAGEELPTNVEMQQAQESFVSDETIAAGGIEWPVIDWNSLRAANPAVVAWVTVPDTRIDYAIVQASLDDPQRYLYYDLYGRYGYYGCPYVDSACAEFGGIDSRAPIVYGHHLITGTMFSDFAKYSNRSYAESHRQILLQTPTENRELRVIAANVVNADYETIETGFPSADELNAYYATKLDESEVVLERPERAQRIYAFICCSYETSNSRTIVYAVDAVEDTDLVAEDETRLAAQNPTNEVSEDVQAVLEG